MAQFHNGQIEVYTDCFDDLLCAWFESFSYSSTKGKDDDSKELKAQIEKSEKNEIICRRHIPNTLSDRI